MEPDNKNLPQEIINRVTDPLTRFLKVEAVVGATLLIATAVAIILTNSAGSTPFLSFWETPIGLHIGSMDFSRSLQHWINDGLMTLFFFLVALELKRELVLGELRSLRMAALPLSGAIGGMIVPASIYFALTKGQPEARGWGIVMATDTAFVIGCLAILKSRVPANLRLYLLSLAIFDDIGAILVVAFGYGDAVNWIALGLGIIGFAIVAGMARIGIRSVPIYSLFGVAIWLCFDASGIHATLAGVVLGLMTPTRSWISDARLRAIFGQVLSYPPGDHWSGDTVDRHDLRQAGTAAREMLSPVERLELRLHPWVGFLIMPLFAFANAGVTISSEALLQHPALAIVAGLTLGKPIGVFSMSWLAARFGLARLLPGLSWPLLAAGGLLTGIGFTMSLFIAGLAFPASLLETAKIGILCASLTSAVAGVSLLILLTSKKSKR